VLEQLVRFYGDPVQGVVSRYIEQSIMTFLEHQEQYRLRLNEFSTAEPLNLMRKALEQNMEFWNNLASSTTDRNRRD
jgi:polyhydroxyalkanoate synthesis regulator protein